MSYYLVRTFANKEKAVSARLQDQGQQVFLPQLNGSPMFPGYLFVGDEIGTFELNRTPGSIGIVMFGETPARAPQAVIDELRETTWDPQDDLPDGSSVRVTSGPFKWLTGIVHKKRHDRIIVLISVLQRCQEIEFKREALEIA